MVSRAPDKKRLNSRQEKTSSIDYALNLFGDEFGNHPMEITPAPAPQSPEKSKVNKNITPIETQVVESTRPLNNSQSGKPKKNNKFDFIDKLPFEERQFNRWAYLSKVLFKRTNFYSEQNFNDLLIYCMPDFENIINFTSARNIESQILSSLSQRMKIGLDKNYFSRNPMSIYNLLSFYSFYGLSNQRFGSENGKAQLINFFKRRMPYYIGNEGLGIDMNEIAAFFRGTLQDVLSDLQIIKANEDYKNNTLEVPQKVLSIISSLVFIDKTIELYDTVRHHPSKNLPENVLEPYYGRYLKHAGKDDLYPGKGYSFVEHLHPKSNKKRNRNFVQESYICIDPANYDEKSFKNYINSCKNRKITPYLCTFEGEDQSNLMKLYKIEKVKVFKRKLENVKKHIDKMASQTFNA